MKWITLKLKKVLKVWGYFKKAKMPVSLHVDTGFDFEKIIYKQTLLALSDVGEL